MTMIVRVLTEGQYRVSDELRARLNELDEQVMAAAQSGDEAAFHERYAQLLGMIKHDCEEVADDELVTSDWILPPSDVTIEEALRDYSGAGLIPD
jgi:hypothetical protein